MVYFKFKHFHRRNMPKIGFTTDFVLKIFSAFENCFLRDVDETLRLVQAFQFTDKNGEVCPAGWKPGSATIIPNPQDKIMYFKNKGPFL